MLLSQIDGEYILRCESAKGILPEIHQCEECGQYFDSHFAAAVEHGVFTWHSTGNHTNPFRWSIIIACEGYHQIRF